MRPPRRSPLRKKLPPRNNPEIGSEIPRLRSGDFLQGAGLQGAAGQTVRRTVSAGEARRPRLRRGGLRPSPPPAPARRKPHHAPTPCTCPPQAAAPARRKPLHLPAASPLHLPAASPTTHRPPAPARRKPLPCPAAAPPCTCPPHLPGPQNRAQPVPAPPEQSRRSLLSPPAAVGLRPAPLPLSANFSRCIDKSPPTCYNGTNNCYYLRRNRL